MYRAELLGQGGFAKPVAIKLLNGEDASDDVVQRLRDEARMLGLIQHRAVVGVDGLVQFQQGWAVIMELVSGVDAAALVHHGPPPSSIALEIVEEVAAALHAAQEMPSPITGEKLSLLHRDIKCSNIRVTHQGQVKVLDFGVARAEFGSREAHTRSVLLGSLRYMAPERYDGIESSAGDIYALGIVLCELLTGETFEEPPKHPRRHARFEEDLAERVRTMQEHTGTPAASLDAMLELVGRMLSFEPEERPGAREVERTCRELRRVLEGPWLKVWAEDHVPVFAAKLPPPTEQGALTGSVLIERALTGALHSTGTAPTQGSAPERDFAPVTPTAKPTTEVMATAFPAAQPPRPSPVRTVLIGLGAAALGAALVFLLVGRQPPAPVEPEFRSVEDLIGSDARMVQKVDSVKGLPQPSEGGHNTDVRVTGVKTAYLEPNKGDRRMAFGAQPPGTYRLMIDWNNDGRTVEAGDVRIEDGFRTSIACHPDSHLCETTQEELH